ncbi:hypothetical protein ACSQ67_005473 [Phaseolus vulgaris]
MEDKTQSESKQNDDDEVAPKPQLPNPSSGGWGFFAVLVSLRSSESRRCCRRRDLPQCIKLFVMNQWGFEMQAAVVAQTASKGIAELQIEPEDSESSKEDEGTEDSAAEKESDDESTKLRKSALDRLEKVMTDVDILMEISIYATCEYVTSVRLENSASNLSGSSQHDGPGTAVSNTSSLLETGRAFTAKGIQVLEYVGKETMDLLINETGIEVEKDNKQGEEQNDEDQLSEEVTFDRCFYIYGGPEQLEELEALSSHYALLFNRRKVKLSAEQKSVHDGKLKEVQHIFNLSAEIDSSNTDSNKGKTIKKGNEGSSDEMKNLHDSSVGKAAEMAAGFTNALSGLAAHDIVQRTTARLESLHSEGVHRLSEMCCFAVSQLLVFGKSIISHANKIEDDDDDDKANIEWPEDVTAKANIIRVNAQTMIGYVEAVSNSFITGISDVAEACQAAIKAVTTESHAVVPHASSVQEKASAFSENLQADQTTAVCKIQEGMQFLAHVLISTSMNAA